MRLTNAQKQAAHRARRDAKMARMQEALQRIAARLEGNTKPLRNRGKGRGIMGKATRTKQRRTIATIGMDATPERLAKSDSVLVGAIGETFRARNAKARWMVPPIDALRNAGKLTDERHAMLAWYAEQVAIGERSPIRDSLNQERYGGDAEPSAAIVSALMNVGRIERDLGSLLDIARAVAVDEWTVCRWCIEKHGGRPRYNDKGQFVCMVPNAERKVTAIALMELNMAADRIVK